MKRFIKNKQLVIGSILLGFVIIIALFAPLFAPHDPIEGSLLNSLQSPNNEFPLGTDRQGRDLLSRIIYGARISLLIGIVSQSINTIIGTTLGLIAGFYGGKIDDLIMGFTNMMLSIPALIFALTIIVLLGPGLVNIFIALGITMWTYTCRLARAQTLSIKENEFVDAAIALGASKFRIITKHILPNIAGPIIVIATIGAAEAILMEASLSFLGIGVQPPTPSWGVMISRGRDYIWSAPYIMIFPGIALIITVMGLNLIGDGLRDILDPYSKID